MRKTLLIFLLLFVVGGMTGCASINTDNQTARIGVKATTIVLIDKGHITKEKLSEVVEGAIVLLGEDSEANIEILIRNQIEWDKLSTPAKLAVDEFILSVKDNVSILDVEIPEKERLLIVLGWVKDAIELY